jgi:hypothetical protein
VLVVLPSVFVLLYVVQCSGQDAAGFIYVRVVILCNIEEIYVQIKCMYIQPRNLALPYENGVRRNPPLSRIRCQVDHCYTGARYSCESVLIVALRYVTLLSLFDSLSPTGLFRNFIQPNF